MNLLQRLSYFFLLTVAISHSLHAQIKIASPLTSELPIVACGTDKMIQNLRSNPLYRDREIDMNQAIRTYSAATGESYLLPVVFHIISENPATITDQQMLDALKDLNDAFARTGSYASGTGVNTRIQFCLAQKDPEGGNTSGITRTVSFLTDFDQDIENTRMKNLVVWDPKKFINIWYVTDIKSEILPRFSCGAWTRLKEGGYASMPPGSDSTDGIVVTGFGPLLAHEMGHYLGLYHTFEGLSCANNNCSTDGDMVCDTPPDNSVSNSPSCSQPQNSCSSDTVSGFSVDVPDLIDNFMDYGNDACHNSFTEGQASRMRAAIATQRSGLLQNECTKPCADNSLANFSRNNPYPLPGDLVSFTNLSTGTTNQEWRINDIAVSTAAGFSFTFPSKGEYKVTLKAFNSDPTCFATYTDDVIVSCGVMARFYPNKRKIASKQPIYPDSIYFTNRSVGAGSYQWLMGNDKGMAEQVISTAADLNYTFADPGNYSVRLVATNGSCTDTSEKFLFTVDDPTADGTLLFSIVNCYDQTKIKLTLSICNGGYAPIPPGTPVSFYDSDPRISGAKKLEPSFILPDTIKGRCCDNRYDHMITVDRPGLDTLYAVFNDNGSAIPIALPNTSLPEMNYKNNLQVAKNFQYKVTVAPAQATLKPGDTLHLSASAGPGNTLSYVWTSAQGLSCIDCPNPVLTVDSGAVKKVTGTSEFGCIDSAFAVIKVPPVNDYSITVDSIHCARQDSLQIAFTVCNGFDRGMIPGGLVVFFYKGDPSLPGAQELGPSFTISENSTGLCASYQHIIQGIDSGTIYALVNAANSLVPVELPNAGSYPESDYANNQAHIYYQSDTLSLLPSDTTVFRNSSFPILILSGSTNPSSAIWSTGNGYTLSCYNCASPVVTAHTNSLVKVELANPFGCTYRGQVSIKTISGGKVSIPNAFTPNGDGRNEVFYVMGGAEIRSVRSFSIFNRWGQLIFQQSDVAPNDPANGWDGRFRGQPAEPGAYVYMINISFNDGSTSLYKGTVTLIR